MNKTRTCRRSTDYEVVEVYEGKNGSCYVDGLPDWLFDMIADNSFARIRDGENAGKFLWTKKVNEHGTGFGAIVGPGYRLVHDPDTGETREYSSEEYTRFFQDVPCGFVPKSKSLPVVEGSCGSTYFNNPSPINPYKTDVLYSNHPSEDIMS